MVVLRDGALRVEVLPELGGRVHRIALGDFDVLRTPDDVTDALADPFFWSGFVMAPWANRVPDAVMATSDGPVHLVPNFDDGSAIHGQVYARPWRVVGPGRLEVTVRPEAGFPFAYTVMAEVTLDSGSVLYTLTLRNDDDRPMPAGLGWHPWFAAHSGSLRITVPARLAYKQTPDYLPVGGPEPIAHGHLDLRGGAVPPWGAHEIYTGLSRSLVTLTWDGHAVVAELSFDAQADHVVVYASRPHDAVAVEPQTHAPDGHRRAAAGEAGGLCVLRPAGRLQVRYRLSVRASTDAAIHDVDNRQGVA